MHPKKVQSVLELARYQVGDVAWWIILRPNVAIPDIPSEDEWMREYHPKALFERGVFSKLWPKNIKLPKLQYRDFEQVVTLIQAQLMVEEFKICDIYRSRDTGEFIYGNSDDEWMPENYLLDTKLAADRERTRVMKMIQKWAA